MELLSIDFPTDWSKADTGQSKADIDRTKADVGAANILLFSKCICRGSKGPDSRVLSF